MAARKPESQFSSSLNKLLPLELHREKMNNPYRSGTADFWYSGNKSDMWVEYKWLPKIPKREYNLTEGTKPSLSVLQQKWLADRHNEGRHVAVVLGSPEGVIILDGLKWSDTVDFTAITTKAEAAKWITKGCMYESNSTSSNSRKNSNTNL